MNVLDYLKENNFDVISIGKISDIFNGCGITEAIRTKDNMDGIEKIKNDDEDDGCGVWDFTIKKIGDNVQLDLVNGLKRYTGKYYIRTTNAEGEWMNYTLPSNYMTYSAYAKKNSGFSGCVVFVLVLKCYTFFRKEL